jgi:hypothetical protein
MNPEIKAVWVKALRSGRYKQGMRALCTVDERWNPFGVLADACFEFEWELDGHEEVWLCHLSSSLLPAWLLAEAGLSLRDERIVVSMNDIQGKSFKQIADWVEKNL